MKKIFALSIMSMLSMNLGDVLAMEHQGVLITQKDALASQALRQETIMFFAKMIVDEKGNVLETKVLRGINVSDKDYSACIEHLKDQYKELNMLNGFKHIGKGLGDVTVGVLAVLLVTGQTAVPYIVDFKNHLLVPVVDSMAQKIKSSLTLYFERAKLAVTTGVAGVRESFKRFSQITPDVVDI